jgi:hypothetical protein
LLKPIDGAKSRADPNITYEFGELCVNGDSSSDNRYTALVCGRELLIIEKAIHMWGRRFLGNLCFPFNFSVNLKLL